MYKIRRRSVIEISNFSPYKISRWRPHLKNLQIVKFTNRTVKFLLQQSDKEVVADSASDVREE